MNCGESNSGMGKRPVINENEKLIVSSGEENTTPNNNKKIKLSKTPKNTKPFSEIWEYYEKGVQKNNGHYEAICCWTSGLEMLLAFLNEPDLGNVASLLGRTRLMKCCRPS
ncbi:hypothetical protein RclHR1_13270003 [Rhizophagus clarus]|uniref:Uncharacterized protein n=1 Tax=Rhizophagus clarus TaxID=94130 RepID=A0A2Z6QQ08_9GLOM|nr:hypothetical protein RclHR1_13270003 [Rhizophagus clarus]